MRILVDMSATLIHHGHIRLLKKASHHGKVIVALTSDKEIYLKKKFKPELEFKYRKEILESIKYVSEVIESPWIINEDFMKQNKIDYLYHGSDNSNEVKKDLSIIVERTEGVSSSQIRQKIMHSIIEKKNEHKLMLTPGPAAVLPEHLYEYGPVFGRGDTKYDLIYEKVINWIKKMTKLDKLVSFQGSATNALELAARTFIEGKVLIVDTGVYSSRFKNFLTYKKIKINHCKYDQLDKFIEDVDWIMATYVETSVGFKSDIKFLRKTADRLGAKLYIDATASIGLEEGHENADVMAFSSCKGLFGMTGAAFIAHKSTIRTSDNDNNSFTSNYDNMKKKITTGPYHAICSLYGVMKNHNEFKKRVAVSKNKVLNSFKTFYSIKEEPLICTRLQKKIRSVDDKIKIVFYKPRIDIEGSIVCHFGEIYKKEQSITDFIEEY